jgi:hypothetical protein
MAEIGSVHKSILTYGDVSEETSPLTIFNDAITAISLPGFLTNLAALETATDNVTIGVRRKSTWVGDETTITNTWPTDKAAHRENKLLVTYIDDTTEKPYTLTIPTIDFSVLNYVPGGGDAVLFAGAGASAQIIAWVTAFEAIASSPDNPGNSVTVTKMRYVGRNT